jgi:hypothetical protein
MRQPAERSMRPGRLGRRVLRCALVALLGTAVSRGGAAAAAEAGVEGHWEGAVVARAGVNEMDLTVDFRRDADRELLGAISVPVEWIKERPLTLASQQGSAVTFSYLNNGTTTVFRGTLEDGGRRLSGQAAEGGEAPQPFVLVRHAVRAAAAPMAAEPLNPDLATLKKRFDADRDDTRLVVILSPACESCWAHARLVARYVLDRIDDPKLRVYFIWLHVADGDTLEAAQRAAGLVSDPRVTQYYGVDRAAGIAFREPLGMKKFWAFDVFLLYGPGDTWRDPAPAPELFMRANPEPFPGARPLDGPGLAAAVRAALAGAAPGGAVRPR